MRISLSIWLCAMLLPSLIRAEEEAINVYEGHADMVTYSVPGPELPPVTLRLKFHVVETPRFVGGSPEIADPAPAIARLVKSLNSIYAESKVAFVASDIDVVSVAPTLREVDSSDDKRRLMDLLISREEAQSYLNIVVVPIRNLGFDGHAHFPWSRKALRAGSGVLLSDAFVFPFSVNGQPGRLVPDVAAHEIGHALGLWHVERGVDEHEIEGLRDELKTALEQEPALDSPGDAAARGDFCPDTPPIPAVGELEMIYKIEGPSEEGDFSVDYLRMPPELGTLLGDDEWDAQEAANLMRSSGDRRFLSAHQASRIHGWIKERLRSWVVDDPGMPVEGLTATPSFGPQLEPGVRLEWHGPVGSFLAEQSATPDFSNPETVAAAVGQDGAPSSHPFRGVGYTDYFLEDYAVTGGQEYWYRVKRDGEDWVYSPRIGVRAAGARAANARPVVKPVPSSIRSVPGGMLVEWEDPDDFDISGYELRRWATGSEAGDPEVITTGIAPGTDRFASVFVPQAGGLGMVDSTKYHYQVVAYFDTGSMKIFSGNEGDGFEQGDSEVFNETPPPSPPVLSYSKERVGENFVGSVSVYFPGKTPVAVSGGVIQATLEKSENAGPWLPHGSPFPIVPGRETPELFTIGGLPTGNNFHYRVTMTETYTDSNGDSVTRTHGTSVSATIRVPGRITDSPVLAGPDAGATNISSFTTLEWAEVEDAFWYEIRLRHVGVEDKIITVPAGDLTYAFTEELAALADYNWRVRGVNDEGPGPWSSAKRFSTGLRPVRLISPAEGSQVSAPPNVDAYSPRFEWDGMPGEVSYRIRIFDEAGTRLMNRKIESQNFFQNDDPAEDLPAGNYTWNVRTFDRANFAIEDGPNIEPYAGSLSGSFSVRTRPVGAPWQQAPTDGSVDRLQRPTFKWHPVAQATDYVIEIIRNNDTSLRYRFGGTSEDNLLRDENGNPVLLVGELDAENRLTFKIPSELPGLGGSRLHYWRMKARNEIDSGVWSAPNRPEDSEDWRMGWLNFRTGLGRPSLLTPGNHTTVSSRHPTFTWSAVGGATQYEVELFKSGTIERTATVGPNDGAPFWDMPSSEQVSSSPDYTWRVRALGPPDNTTVGEWTDTFALTIYAEPGNAPTQLSPPNTHVNLSTLPFFQWSALQQATSYDLEVIQIRDNGSVNTRIDVQGITDTVYYVPEEDRFRGDRQHFWRVRGRNSVGAGPWSGVAEDHSDWFEFRTTLDKPVLLTPVNGVTGESLTPTFDWADVSGADGYTFEMWGPNNNRLESRTQNTINSILGNQVNAPLDGDKQYYWRVKATGPTTESAFSDFFALKTRVAPPKSAPSQLSPPNTHVNLSTLPFFQWQALGDASSYDLEIVQIRLNGSSMAAKSYQGVSGTVFYLPEADRFKGDRQHFWRIRGRNSAGTGPWSGTASNRSDWFEFRTRLDTPILLTPVNGKTNETTTPTFDWADVNGASSYIFEMWGPNGRIDGRTQTTTNSILGNNINSPLKVGKQYTWRVKAVGPTTESAFSGFFSIMAN